MLDFPGSINRTIHIEHRAPHSYIARIRFKSNGRQIRLLPNGPCSESDRNSKSSHASLINCLFGNLPTPHPIDAPKCLCCDKIHSLSLSFILNFTSILCTGHTSVRMLAQCSVWMYFATQNINKN